MVSQLEVKLYMEASNRARNRVTEGQEFEDECVNAFQNAIAFNPVEFKAENFLPESNDGFSRVCGLLTVIQARKGKSYAASWQKRGMTGALANLQRKMDRIDEIINHGNSQDVVTENLTSQLADMAVYAILMLSLEVQLLPEELFNWLREIHNL